jgi:hypothetical protein
LYYFHSQFLGLFDHVGYDSHLFTDWPLSPVSGDRQSTDDLSVAHEWHFHTPQGQLVLIAADATPSVVITLVPSWGINVEADGTQIQLLGQQRNVCPDRFPVGGPLKSHMPFNGR